MRISEHFWFSYLWWFFFSLPASLRNLISFKRRNICLDFTYWTLLFRFLYDLLLFFSFFFWLSMNLFLFPLSLLSYDWCCFYFTSFCSSWILEIEESIFCPPCRRIVTEWQCGNREIRSDFCAFDEQISLTYDRQYVSITVLNVSGNMITEMSRVCMCVCVCECVSCKNAFHSFFLISSNKCLVYSVHSSKSLSNIDKIISNYKTYPTADPNGSFLSIGNWLSHSINKYLITILHSNSVGPIHQNKWNSRVDIVLLKQRKKKELQPSDVMPLFIYLVHLNKITWNGRVRKSLKKCRELHVIICMT